MVSCPSGLSPVAKSPNLADRLRGLVAMVIEADEMSATTAMTYRLQGAVDGSGRRVRGPLDALGLAGRVARTRSEGSKSPTPR